MEKHDEVIIETEFMKGIISKLLHKALEKTGYDAEVYLSEFNISNQDEKVRVHLNADMEISTAELEKALDKFL